MKEILFLIPVKLTRPYFSSLYCECERRLYSRFIEELRPIWRGVPRETEEFDEEKVIEVLRRETRQSRAIKLLVVAPTASEQFTIGVAKVARAEKLPVLALSLPFQFPEVFSDHGLPVPAAVHCDSEIGTKELACAASRELVRRRRTSRSPRVVL